MLHEDARGAGEREWPARLCSLRSRTQPRPRLAVVGAMDGAAQDDDDVALRKSMSEQMAQDKPSRSRLKGEKKRLAVEADEAFATVVNNAIGYLDAQLTKLEQEELEARHMRKSNAQVTFLVQVLRKRGPPTRCLVDASASAHISELQGAVKSRCGLKSKRVQLLWIDRCGATVELKESFN